MNSLPNNNGMLSDIDIKKYLHSGDIKIFTNEHGELAFNMEKQLQPGSVDLRFRHECKKIIKKNDILTYESVEKHDYLESFEAIDGRFVIEPGEVIITTTLEMVILTPEFGGFVSGRSSFARLGIRVHCTQSFINPGHAQSIPLQIINDSPNRIELDLRTPICQLVLFKMKSPSSKAYSQKPGAKYAKETSVEASKIYEEAHETKDSKPYNKRNNGVEKLPNKKAIKKGLQKWINPILQSIIAAIICSYFLLGSQGSQENNKGLSVVVQFLSYIINNIPLTVVIIFVIIGLYIWINKGEE